MTHSWGIHPRTYGKATRYCRFYRNTHDLIRKYDLDICRRCFRERAHLLGFTQTR
jgi:small subunit ribosomal protein S29e